VGARVGRFGRRNRIGPISAERAWNHKDALAGTCWFWERDRSKGGGPEPSRTRVGRLAGETEHQAQRARFWWAAHRSTRKRWRKPVGCGRKQV
jgi:hypothetical protein